MRSCIDFFSSDRSNGFVFDLGAMWTVILEQGGYAPAPLTAAPEDQMYMVRVGVEAMRFGYSPDGYAAWLQTLRTWEYAWLSELGSTPPQDMRSYAEWLRENVGNPFAA